MYKLHSEKVELGDTVYDVSASRGVGRVIMLSSAGIEVEFSSGSRTTYNERGIQRGKNRSTLFWRDPIIFVPAKSERVYSAQKTIAATIKNVLLEVTTNG